MSDSSSSSSSALIQPQPQTQIRYRLTERGYSFDRCHTDDEDEWLEDCDEVDSLLININWLQGTNGAWENGITIHQLRELMLTDLNEEKEMCANRKINTPANQEFIVWKQRLIDTLDEWVSVTLVKLRFVERVPVQTIVEQMQNLSIGKSSLEH
jgi:hypothetical protein